ncbi:acylneuraminate cytidylyltransferase family protein [Desulforhopalus sp. IMCC35007]|nr:acylneuraminate cytidylyltransferase family protein [Desulforhopalus sp. IMCC35007]
MILFGKLRSRKFFKTLFKRDCGLKNVTAIITARGGSKGIPRKNIVDIHGVPLIAYTILAAHNCQYIDECYVTTEDAEIKAVSKQYGAQVINRPPELAGDHSLSQEAVVDALKQIAKRKKTPEYFALLQPTSPLRNSTHLHDCIKYFFQSGCLSAISVTEAEHHPWKMVLSDNGLLVPVIDSRTLEKPRQQLPKAFRVNGAIYIISSKLFLEKESFFVEPVYPYEMNREDSLDIDNYEDLNQLDSILQKRAQVRGE